MSEGVIITVDMVIKPEFAEQVAASIPAMFYDTVRFEGFRSIRVVRHKNEPNHLMVIEHWDEEANYKAYMAWRNRNGEMDAALSALVSINTEVWPSQIGFASV
jgi:quinol monooxygenase YgiN